MASKILVTLAVSGLSVSGCFNTPISSMGSVSTSVQGAKLAAAGTTETKSVSTIDSNSTESIQLSAPVIEGMSGAGVTIAPGSLGISVDLVVEQAADISDTSMMDEMGLAEDIQISSATPGMIIRPSENVDLKKPLSISMPLPVGLSFHLNTGSKYAILYKYFDPSEQKLVTGMKIMDGTNVKLSFDEASGKDVLSFDGYFGAYWAVILSREVVAAEVPPPKPAEQPIMNKSNVPVISSTGVVKETEIVKTQAVVELVWSKPSIKFVSEQRSLSLHASLKTTDQKITACKADLFENTTVRSGLVIDAPTGPQLEFVINNTKAHNIVGRFRCIDSLGRITVTPWSDSIAVPAVPSIAPPVATAPVIDTSPGVEATTANLITISGVLKPVKSLFLLTTSAGKGDTSYREIPVDASGYFVIPIDRSTVLANRVQTKLNADPIVRDSAFVQDVADLFYVPYAEALQHTTGPTDTELREEMLSDVAAIIQKGNDHSLVAFTKAAPNRIAEANSFKFIGLPTPSGNALFRWNSKKLKGNLRLGEINAEIAGDEVLSTVASIAALNETTEIQEGLAAMGRSIKSVKNTHMNDGWQADPSFTWRSDAYFSSLTTTYTSVSAPVYQGYGFHIEQRNQPLPYTYDTICNSGILPLSFVAPTTIVAKINDVDTSVTSLSNRDSFGSGTPGERRCNGPEFFAEERGSDRITTGFGNGSSIILGQIPGGLWRYNYDGIEHARFDFSYFKPWDSDGNTAIYIPSYKLIKDGTDYVGASVKFWLYAGGIHVAVTDLTVLRRLMKHAQFSFWGMGGNHHTDLIFTDGSSEATANFTNPIPESEVTSAAAEYSMGSQRYRFEIHNQP